MSARLSAIVLLLVVYIPVCGQLWLTDPKGCKFYDPYAKDWEKPSVLWNGKCVNGLMEGNGMLSKYKDGKLFVTFYGVLAKGKYTNKVSWFFESGNSYEGGFDPVKGLMSGKGKYSFFTGDYYDGQWKNDSRNGKGIYHYANGSEYEGQWRNDEMNGLGKFTLPDKSFYYGLWERDILLNASEQNAIGKYIPKDSAARYVVDTKLRNEITEHTKKAKQGVDGLFKLTVFRGNEKVISQDSVNTPFRMINQEARSNKKILLALAGAFDGMGFQINMFDQKYQLFFYVKSTAPIFKLHASDTTYNNYLYVPCTRKKLIIDAIPEYSATETMRGKVELSSVEFFERNENGTDQKYRAELTGYFVYKEPEE